MKAHSEPNTVECESCGKRFSLRAAYANHIKIHGPAISGRSRRRHRRVYEKSPTAVPSLPPALPQVVVQPCSEITYLPPVEQKCWVEADEAGSDPAVRCFACAAPIQSPKMWSHLQRSVQELLQACEDTAVCLQQYDAVLEP